MHSGPGVLFHRHESNIAGAAVGRETGVDPPHQPPGWSYNPSAWRHRLPVLALGLLGLAIAVDLGLYQLDILPGVWEPFFGDGSRVILKESAITRWLHPVPDALLGAFAYFCDVVFNAIGGRVRWRTQPWAAVISGLIGCALGVAGVALVLCQAFWFRHFCTLCLGSAACSVLTFALVVGEFWATIEFLKRQRANSQPLWRSLLGERRSTSQ